MFVSLASHAAPDTAESEDVVVASDRVAVVLDGVSVPPGMDTGCSHGTPWFARTLGANLLARLLDPARDLPTALAEAIRFVTDQHAHVCDLSHPGTPAATVSVVRERGSVLEYLVLSDSIVLLQTASGVQVIADQAVEQTAQAEFAAVVAAPIGGGDHAARRAEMIAVRRAARNVPGGYWIASTAPNAAHHATVGEVPLSDLVAAAVLSDGAARIVEPFGLADWPELMRLMQSQGPATLIERVRAAEASDPDGARWPRSKRHDDATAVICRF